MVPRESPLTKELPALKKKCENYWPHPTPSLCSLETQGTPREKQQLEQDHTVAEPTRENPGP